MVFARAVRQSARGINSRVRRQSATVTASASSAKDTVCASAIQTRSYYSSSVKAQYATGFLVGFTTTGIVMGKIYWDALFSSTTSSGAEVTREHAVLYMAELTAEVKNLLHQLPEIKEAVRSSMKDDNIEPTDERFREAMLQHLNSIFIALDEKITSRHQWDSNSMEQAQEKFVEDEEILELQLELAHLFPAPEHVEIPEHMTTEKTLAICKSELWCKELAMQATLKHAASEGITDATKAMEDFKDLYLKEMDLAIIQLMKAQKISTDILTATVLKHRQEDAQFRKQSYLMYTEQAENFRKVGLNIDEW